MSSNKNKLEMQHILDDLQKNHNHTWYEELYLRNCNWLDDTALFYRGNNISYNAMFESMQNYANSLRAFGLQEGDEIPVCMANMPELVYLLGAISIIGAKANIFGCEFDSDYITEIIDGCTSDLIFILDNAYSVTEEAINASHVNKIVMCSLTDSLPKDGNPYAEYDQKHGVIQNSCTTHIANHSNIITFADFESFGRGQEDVCITKAGLDAEFLITYTSGSTNTNRPKAIVHTTRSLITIGRCHDPEVQKTTSLKNFTMQAHIPTHSNTDIIASISDALMQGARLALEPVYDKDFFIYTLLINKPSYIVATRSFWIDTAKKILFDPEFADITLRSVLIAFAVGEPMEINEERLINRALHKAKAGTDKVPLPFSIVAIGAAGGDCEHGGIFYNIFRQIQNAKPANLLHHQEQGLMPFAMVDTAVLDYEGKHCESYQLGRLVANSPCNMKCYKNNPEATDAFFIKDAAGKTWGDCRVYGYIDAQGGVHMKGRIPDAPGDVPLFQIAEAVLRDRKNILSCEVVEVDESYVAHVEFVPGLTQDQKSVLKKAQKRCLTSFGKEVTDRIYWRIRNNEESFPLTGCGKRSVKALSQEGISSNCFKLK